MTDDEKLDQVTKEYATKFGNPDMPALPDFFEQQLPDEVFFGGTDAICAYIRKRIAENRPFEDEYCGEI